MESTEMKWIRSGMLQKCRETFLHMRARGKNKILLNKKKKNKKRKKIKKIKKIFKKYLLFLFLYL